MICSSVNLDLRIVHLLADGLTFQMRDQLGRRPVAWPKVAETIEVEFRGELNGQAVADSTLRQAYQRWRGNGAAAIAAE